MHKPQLNINLHYLPTNMFVFFAQNNRHLSITLGENWTREHPHPSDRIPTHQMGPILVGYEETTDAPLSEERPRNPHFNRKTEPHIQRQRSQDDVRIVIPST